MIRTKNFTPEIDIKLKCTCGHIECDKRSVNQSTLDKLQKVRDMAGRGIVVTSGGRCPHHKNEQGRKTPADHQRQQGVDVKVTGGIERGEIVALGLKAGFNAIGVAKGFIHLGHRLELKPDEVIMWTY